MTLLLVKMILYLYFISLSSFLSIRILWIFCLKLIWDYNYLCNRCLSPLMLWVRLRLRVRFSTLCDKVCQRLVAGRWFSPGPLVSTINKTECHDIAEILLNLKVALNTITLTLFFNTSEQFFPLLYYSDKYIFD